MRGRRRLAVDDIGAARYAYPFLSAAVGALEFRVRVQPEADVDDDRSQALLLRGRPSSGDGSVDTELGVVDPDELERPQRRGLRTPIDAAEVAASTLATESSKRCSAMIARSNR